MDSKIDEEIKNVNAERRRESVKSICITGVAEQINLDMMAFVTKSMNYESEKERLQGNIKTALVNALVECLDCRTRGNLVQAIENAVDESIEEKSLFSELENMKYGYEVAFPFYNLDMSYNVYKRVRRDMLSKARMEEELFDVIIDFYNLIGEKLENESEYYQEDAMFRYLEIYNECPYIKAIRKIKEKKKSKVPERIIKAFNSIVVTFPS